MPREGGCSHREDRRNEDRDSEAAGRVTFHSGKGRGANPEGLSTLVDKQCAATLGLFDDPLLQGDETVRAKRPDVLQLTQTIAAALQQLVSINATVATGLGEAKEKAAKDAKTAAAEAREKEKVAADASKAADVIIRPKTSEGGSASSASVPSVQEKADEITALKAALAKPIGERNGEELVLAGRAAGKASKVRKIDTAAADLDLANVGDV